MAKRKPIKVSMTIDKTIMKLVKLLAERGRRSVSRETERAIISLAEKEVELYGNMTSDLYDASVNDVEKILITIRGDKYA